MKSVGMNVVPSTSAEGGHWSASAAGTPVAWKHSIAAEKPNAPRAICHSGRRGAAKASRSATRTV